MAVKKKICLLSHTYWDKISGSINIYGIYGIHCLSCLLYNLIFFKVIHPNNDYALCCMHSLILENYTTHYKTYKCSSHLMLTSSQDCDNALCSTCIQSSLKTTPLVTKHTYVHLVSCWSSWFIIQKYHICSSAYLHIWEGNAHCVVLLFMIFIFKYLSPLL